MAHFAPKIPPRMMTKLTSTFVFFALVALATAYTPDRWWTKPGLCSSEIKTHAQPRTWPTSHGWHDRTLEWIHEKLITCPSLTSLDLSIGITGCEVYSGPQNLPLDPFNNTKYVAALESLELQDYELDGRILDWATEPPVWYKEPLDADSISEYEEDGIDWRHFQNIAQSWSSYTTGCSLPESQCHLTNLELWTKAMDFSKLRHLALAGCTGDVELLTTHLAPKLSSLRSLSFSGSKYVDMFLALGKNTLHRIALVNNDPYQESEFVHFDKFKAYMAHHADSLKSLEWRMHETHGTLGLSQIPMSDLRNLHTLAPNLEELTMDLNRNGTWPMEVLDAIVEGAPASLKNLTLYLELTSDCRHQQDVFLWGSSDDAQGECLGIDRYRQPILNAETATPLFNHLIHKAHEAGKPALTTAKFRSGYWGRIVQGGGLILGYPWLEEQQKKNFNGDVTCTMLRDDGSRYELGGGICSSPRDPSKYYGGLRPPLFF
ncbi:hypothetical protein PG985_002482 [Apiospora marii]|uniref:uncharacterized protein n=1 Tax=Apiospora marii TaxID=335849 RepID=UPI00312FD309